MQPIFVHPQHELKMVDHLIWEGYDVEHIIPGEFLELAHEKGFKKILPVYNTESLEKTYQHTDNCIVQIKQSEISKLSALIIHLIMITAALEIKALQSGRIVIFMYVLDFIKRVGSSQSAMFGMG